MIYEWRSKLSRLREPEHGSQIHNDLWVVFPQAYEDGEAFVLFASQSFIYFISSDGTRPDGHHIVRLGVI